MRDKREQWAALERLAGMILDARQMDLRRAAAVRDASLAALAALDRPSQADLSDDIAPVAIAQAALRYEAWADQRRAEINPVLARQTVAWDNARRAAAQAFGKAEALRALRKKTDR